jgi:formylglycine-generating enzyme required for sulfatase activity
MHSREGRSRAKGIELAPRIEPALHSLKWSGGTAEDFLRTIRDESGLLTGWDQEHYGFMHLGFQEYLAAREIRSRAFSDPSVLSTLAKHFGESWWQEVGLLLLALEDPSLFEPYMRELLKQPAVTEYPELVGLCLDDAAETSPLPFVEILKKAPGKNKQFWARQLVALRVLERLEPPAVEKLQSILARHPSVEIRRWLQDRVSKAGMDVTTTLEGSYELVGIPDGEFMMGSSKLEEGGDDDEGPLHKVSVPGFYMGRYPVTNEQYGQFLNKKPEIPEPEFWADRQFNQPRQPVVGVSWEDAQRFAAWAGLRLPSEVEWEYACRAGTQTRYYAGDTEKDLDRAGWYDENSGDKLHPVGEKEPNGFGLYDMHGNVWEWLEDDWHGNYEGAPDDGRAWVDKPRDASRVIRGGSWYLTARDCRSAIRYAYAPDIRFYFVGFRLARSVTLDP